MQEEFSQLLLKWYTQNARSLPWRGHPDPYAVWVSEIMLQQTRVETVIPYFERWMAQFPDIVTLAQTEEDDVLNAWEGLGYYSRVRSLRKAAILLMAEFNGVLPSDYAGLLSLPGIGAYTAAAIASIAFNLDHAVVDGNVKRVLARVFNYDQPINTPTGESELQAIADQLLPPGKAGDYNQAVMDLGAMVCTPRSPNCPACPVISLCVSRKNSFQAQRPVMQAKAQVPHFFVTAAILHRDGQVLIAKRPSKGLLGGLWEFPGGKIEEGETHIEALRREIREELGTDICVNDLLGKYRHAYTHFKVTLFAYHCTTNQNEPKALEASEIRWVKINELDKFPMGKIDRMISNDLRKE